MKQELPDGWNEELTKGLWDYETMFGVPWFMVWPYIVLVVAGIFWSWWCFYAIAIIHLLAKAVTVVEPEWPDIIVDMMKEPGDIEP